MFLKLFVKAKQVVVEFDLFIIAFVKLISSKHATGFKKKKLFLKLVDSSLLCL
jgi:hypothetical protein